MGSRIGDGRFAALIEKRSSLMRFFRNRVGADDAEDLAHEVYFRLLRLDDRLSAAIENPESYLFSIARNLLAERTRLLHRHGIACSLDDLDRETAGSSRGGENDIDLQHRSAYLAKIIEELKPRLRAVMIMRYREGMSYKEMAAHLDVSVHAIKKYLGEARYLCRLAMKRQGYR